VLRRLRSLLVALTFALCSATSFAGPLDKAANEKIDEAINKHYLATAFNKAESQLLGTLTACGGRCSRSVMARAWMYIGIVRGSGKNDLEGAEKAFKHAVYLDMYIVLDDALATPETKDAFEKALDSGGVAPPGKIPPAETPPVTPTPPPAPPPTPPPAPTTAPPPTPTPPTPTPPPKPTPAPKPPPPKKAPLAPALPAALECTPKFRVVQTRRPIPMECTSGAQATRGEIRYKEYGGEKWQTVRMSLHGDYGFRGTIPCAATMLAGTLQLHVVLIDPAGNVVDTLGSPTNPLVFKVQPTSKAPPPAFPGEKPPARCAEEVECPPDFPGCKVRGDKVIGDSCDSDSECRVGLVCIGATCVEAQACEITEECPEGSRCVAGTCTGTTKPGAAKYKQNWFGLHLAQDIVVVGGTDVCSTASQSKDDYACFTEEGDFILGSSLPIEGLQGKVDSGIVLATTRLLASYERAFTERITAGARLGFAFGGGPKTYGGTKFMPFHVELRGAYYLASLGKRLRPYVALGGGIAQVDTKISKVEVAADQATLDRDGAQVITVWKKTGQSFATLSGGAAYGLFGSWAAQANLNLVLLFPSNGLSIQPSLGVVYGL
jgi:hypothetical protein